MSNEGTLVDSKAMKLVESYLGAGEPSREEIEEGIHQNIAARGSLHLEKFLDTPNQKTGLRSFLTWSGSEPKITWAFDEYGEELEKRYEKKGGPLDRDKVLRELKQIWDEHSTRYFADSDFSKKSIMTPKILSELAKMALKDELETAKFEVA